MAEKIVSTTRRAQMHQIAESSDSSEDWHDASSQRHTGSSSEEDDQHSPKWGERNAHFLNPPLSRARYWDLASDMPSKPSDPAPNEQQTALELDLREDKDVRPFRKQCNNRLGGFRNEHELHSHLDREHSKVPISTFKNYICVQPTGPGHPTPVVPLSACKSCMQKNQYGTYYNAAAHIRRVHLKSNSKARCSISIGAARIGGEGRSLWPPMPEVKSWVKEVKIAVTESTSSLHPNLADFDDDVDDDFSLSSNLVQDIVSDGRPSFLANSQLRDIEKLDKSIFDSGPSVPTTLDGLYSYKYLTVLDSDLSKEYGYWNPSTMRPTPASLGWNRDTELVKLYTFIVPKGREPFLELLPEWTPTCETPSRVYLDKPSSNMEKNHYPCQYPGTCTAKKAFGRPADLNRHYMWVHAHPDNRDSFSCDYEKCTRSKDPFTRKDFYRDHLRDFHKEDIGCAKRQNKGKDKRQWKVKVEIWQAERKVSPHYWRCTDCLVKNCIHQVGWECSSCRKPCEDDRIKVRERLVGEKSDLSADDCEASPIMSHQNCNVCKGKSNLSGSWATRPVCQASAPYQDSNGYEDFDHSLGSYPRMQDMDRPWMGQAARPMYPYLDSGVFVWDCLDPGYPNRTGDRIIASDPEISANTKARMLPDTLDKQSGQNKTAITYGQVRKDGAQAAPQTPDTSARFGIHLRGIREGIELRVDQHHELVKPKYQRPKRDRIYCKQCDSTQKGFRGEHELRRHQDREH